MNLLELLLSLLILASLVGLIYLYIDFKRLQHKELLERLDRLENNLKRLLT